jgi:hypothetical protein
MAGAKGVYRPMMDAGGLWGQPQPRRWHGFPFNFCISLVQRSGQTKATPDPKEAEEVDMVGAAVC